MLGTRSLQFNSMRAEALRDLDDLIQHLDQGLSQVCERPGPGLEVLARALKTARQLRQRIAEQDDHAVDWHVIVDAVLRLVKLAEQIFSLLFCYQSRGVVMETGSTIKLLRVSQGIPQGRLARKLDVTQAYLSQVENNKRQPSLTLLKDVADVLRVPLVLLIAEQGTGSGVEDIDRSLRRLLGELLTVYTERQSGMRTDSTDEEADCIETA